jgi:hypothetical protein
MTVENTPSNQDSTPETQRSQPKDGGIAHNERSTPSGGRPKIQPWKEFFQPSEDYIKDGKEMVVMLGDGVASGGSNEGGF